MDRYAINATEASQLPNKLGLTDSQEINEAELIGFLRTQNEAIDSLNDTTLFSLEYLYALHKKALSELYDFAGKLRVVNMSKEGFAFPAAAFLPDTMNAFTKAYLEPINRNEWQNPDSLLVHLASMHAELLYIHPFREGNGRTIRLFTDLISLAKLGKQINFEVITREGNFKRYIAGVQQAAVGEYSLMQELFTEMQA